MADPVRQEARSAFEYSLEIGGILYLIAFRWNARFAFWCVDLSASDGAPIYLGRKLVLDYPLYLDAVVDTLPPQIMLALDSQGLLPRIERQHLGNEAQVYASI